MRDQTRSPSSRRRAEAHAVVHRRADPTFKNSRRRPQAVDARGGGRARREHHEDGSERSRSSAPAEHGARPGHAAAETGEHRVSAASPPVVDGSTSARGIEADEVLP